MSASEVLCGIVKGISRFNDNNHQYNINVESRQIAGQFGGLSFGPINNKCDFQFDIPDVPDPPTVVESIITANNKPMFVRIRKYRSEIFLLAVGEILDIDEYIHQPLSTEEHFSRLIPVMMFLKYNFGDYCWHCESPRACFMIDDPLLRMEYGFLNYELLLRTLQKQQMCASIAFIPWNCRRTSKEVANLLLSHPDRYSLSIHGCDHNRAEFGSTDQKLLSNKAIKALQRMHVHRQLSGVPFDEVMVFPQGIFTTTAMKALKSCGYRAAVNTTPYPIDVADNPITLAELLDVAVTKFSNLPLFVRHYPKNLAEMALTLFLGQQVLLVGHHGYFRKGYEGLAEFVDKLNALDGRLEWTNLANICTRACLTKRAERGEIYVRFYTDTFWLQNNARRNRTYVLFRRQVPEKSVTCVTVNGQFADFGQEADWLKIQLALGALESAEIRIEYGGSEQAAITSAPMLMHNIKTLVRRFLSEFRDNYLDTNWLLTKAISTAQSFHTRRK
jgi:peptidoglycan/xylan/chitin deacetylase (PgdA/CDA1 family)